MTPVQLRTRLNIGGRWYLRGDIVRMNDKDVSDYVAMRMVRPLSETEVAGLERAPAVSGKPYDPPSFKDEARTVKVGDVVTKDGSTPMDAITEVVDTTVAAAEDSKRDSNKQEHSTQGKHNRRR